MNNIDMIKMIISDINISKDEKYMLLIFKLSNEENKNNVTINIKALMEQFESRRKAKIFDILKSLQNKGYIEIIKNKGKSNNYKLVKSYLDNVNTGSKNDTSIKNDTTSSVVSDTTIENINNNINNNNNNINNIYNKILITWNKININNEKFINNQVVEAMNTAIKTYKIYEIIDAIKNYSKVYSSDHYYSYRWNLIKFLTQSNGIRRFLNTGDIWLDYKSRYYSRQDEIRNLGIDIENYID
ncbi:hypothetical protein [Clostridium celatum]|uniref:hypothetical protein n=1 Tax=Clostridium celatum TaxID=36834 RepID=UPI00319DCDD4